MKTVVFLGPTLSAHEVEQRLSSAAIRPPAARGDVLEAIQQGFRRVALIDGYFDQKQPVWHKEILWALERGCLVYGAASMGALRAAELHEFGMIGVGRIFEFFRDGVLDADDEVAVSHEDELSGFRATSIALVNMRVTLRRAVVERVLSMDTARSLTTIAEGAFYPDRSYEALLARMAEGRERSAFAAWIGNRSNRVDQKAADGLRLLEELGSTEREPLPAAFEMARTEAWYELEREHACRAR